MSQTRSRALRPAQRLEGRDRIRRLEVRISPVTGEPRVRLERARIAAPDTYHDTRVVSTATQEIGEHGGAAQAAVTPDPPTAVQNAVDVKGQLRGNNAFPASAHAREPRERSVRRQYLERARNRHARHHDLELGAQPHVSQRPRRSPLAPGARHYGVYVGIFASAETLR